MERASEPTVTQKLIVTAKVPGSLTIRLLVDTLFAVTAAAIAIPATVIAPMALAVPLTAIIAAGGIGALWSIVATPVSIVVGTNWTGSHSISPCAGARSRIGRRRPRQDCSADCQNNKASF